MNRLRRIMLILILVLLMPVLFFSVHEFSSLNEDEEMIRDIYEKQLDALLFSANQYSDDVLSGWINDFQSVLRDTSSDSQYQVFQLNTAITFAMVADTVSPHEVIMIKPKQTTEALTDLVGHRLEAQDSVIRQLAVFHESGFQKIEAQPILIDSLTDNILFLFHLAKPADKHTLGILIIDIELFIEEVLGPKLQSIAQRQFELSVRRKKSQDLVYTTWEVDSLVQSSGSYSKDLWLLPDYELAIDTKGKSLQAIINERTYTNLALILILNLAIFIGVWLIFRNVKREVQLAQSKSDFVSNVSHEIRTPLALISLFAETLLHNRVRDENKRQEYYGVIQKEANRLTSIVNKILSFSQLDANKRTLEFKHIRLNDLIREIIGTYEYHLSTNGFEWTIEERAEITVWADKNALEEIFINLIDNAVKYSQDKKEIRLILDKKDDMAIVQVKDRGAGIAKKDLEFIFDKFYRVHTGDLAKKKGTGLGLSLVRQLVEKHGGQVKVQSELHVGTTFFVYLPLSKIDAND